MSDSEAIYQGALGRTTRVSSVVVSNSGDAFTASIYRSINISQDPKLLAELKADKLNHVDCPYSGERYKLDTAIALHDETNRRFAILVPSTLRHRAFKLRAEILDELALSDATIPAYVTQASIIFSPDDLPLVKAVAADKASTGDLDGLRERLDIERQQLDDVRERFDRERERMDAQEKTIADERAAFKKERDAFEKEKLALVAKELNLEQQRLTEDHGDTSPREETQMVTDDQFLEVVDEEAASPELLASASDFSEVEEEFDVLKSEKGLPKHLKELASAGKRRTLKIHNDMVVAVAQVGATDLEKSLASDPKIFTQLHVVASFPIIAVVAAYFDDDNQTTLDVSWTLDITDDSDRIILDKLKKKFDLRVGLYDSSGKLSHGYKIQTPLASNIAWIVDSAESSIKKLKPKKKAFSKAEAAFLKPGFARIGKMRHPFKIDSFAVMERPSDVKLATGIVGYWSTPEMFEYLVSNRSFPMHQFRTIQERVVTAAVKFGLALSDSLRPIAVDLKLAGSDRQLVELQLANFAEVCVSIKANDLEPAEQWENWDELLTLGDSLGLPADPDVVELAETSLRRAQDIEALEEAGYSAEDVKMASESTKISRTPYNELVIAKRSETTGITYYLPNDSVLDTFDDLSTMSREDLEKMLSDESGRLEAAQMLIEKFGSLVTAKVLRSSEKMNESEVVALARFLETKADGLQGELVRVVESAGPSAVYVATRALSAVKSTAAIPALMEAYKDPKRNKDTERFATALSMYGEKLLPALTRSIKVDGPSKPLVALLSELENRVGGTLNALSKDRSKHLREAAKQARKSRDAQTN